MKLDDKTMFEGSSSINSKIGHYSLVVRQAVPVNEGKYPINATYT